jgi:hypothetical protein
MRWLEALNEQPEAGSRLADPTVRDAVERYVVGSYGMRFRDPDFWNQRITAQSMARFRPYVDAMLARHPSVTSEELAAATVAAAPERERMQRAIAEMGADMGASTAVMTRLLVVFTTGMCLVFVLVSALLIPGGIVTRLAGLAVVTGDGVEIGRLRSVGRAAIAWSPAIAVWLMTRPAAQVWSRDVQTPAAAVLGLSVLVAGAAVALIHPARGLHDRMAGTWVIPR